MNPNTGFTGSISINAGQINLQSGSALGSSTGVTVSPTERTLVAIAKHDRRQSL